MIGYNSTHMIQIALLLSMFQVLKAVYAYLLVKMFDLLDTVSKLHFSET